MQGLRKRTSLFWQLGLACLCFHPASTLADKIKNPTVVFSGLDKITGRIISFEVAVNETVQFGALQLTPRLCYSRPATESPLTTGFVEIEEVGLDSKAKRLFTGWMFSASPGLHGVEHPTYDVWLTDCKGGTEIIREEKESSEEPTFPESRPAQDRPRKQTPKQTTPREDPPRQQAPGQQAPSRRYFPNNAPLGVPDPGR
jgi:hypothetical protein